MFGQGEPEQGNGNGSPEDRLSMYESHLINVKLQLAETVEENIQFRKRVAELEKRVATTPLSDTHETTNPSENGTEKDRQIDDEGVDDASLNGDRSVTQDSETLFGDIDDMDSAVTVAWEQGNSDFIAGRYLDGIRHYTTAASILVKEAKLSQSRCAKAVDEKATAESQLHAMESKLSELQVTLDNEQARVLELSQQSEALELELKVERDSNRINLETIAQLEQQHEALRQEAEATLASTRQELEAALGNTDEIEAMQMELRSLQEQLSESNALHAKEKDSLLQELEESKLEASRDRDALLEEIEQIKETSSTQMDQLVAAHKAETDQLVAAHKAETEQLVAAHKAETDELTELREKYEASVQVIKQLEEGQNSFVGEQSSKIEQLQSEIVKLNETNSVAFQDLEEAEQKIMELNDNIEAITAEHENTIRNLQVELEAMAGSAQNVEDAHRERDEALQRLDAIERDNSQLQENCAKLRQELSEIESKSAELMQFQQRAQVAEAECAELRNKFENVTKQMEELTAMEQSNVTSPQATSQSDDPATLLAEKENEFKKLKEKFDKLRVAYRREKKKNQIAAELSLPKHENGETMQTSPSSNNEASQVDSTTTDDQMPPVASTLFQDSSTVDGVPTANGLFEAEAPAAASQLFGEPPLDSNSQSHSMSSEAQDQQLSNHVAPHQPSDNKMIMQLRTEIERLEAALSSASSSSQDEVADLRRALQHEESMRLKLDKKLQQGREHALAVEQSMLEAENSAKQLAADLTQAENELNEARDSQQRMSAVNEALSRDVEQLTKQLKAAESRVVELLSAVPVETVPHHQPSALVDESIDAASPTKSASVLFGEPVTDAAELFGGPPMDNAPFNDTSSGIHEFGAMEPSTHETSPQTQSAEAPVAQELLASQLSEAQSRESMLNKELESRIAELDALKLQVSSLQNEVKELNEREAVARDEQLQTAELTALGREPHEHPDREVDGAIAAPRPSVAEELWGLEEPDQTLDMPWGQAPEMTHLNSEHMYREKVAKLEEQVARLEQELQNAKSSSSSEVPTMNWEDVAPKADVQVSELQQQLETSRRAMADRDATVADLERQIEELENQLQQAQQDAADFQSSLRVTTAAQQSAEPTSGAPTLDWNATVADTGAVAALQEKLQAAELALAEREKTVKELQDQVASMHAQSATTVQETEESPVDVPTMDWNATVADTEDVAALQEKLQAAELALAEREKTVKELQDQVASMHAQSATTVQETEESPVDVPTMDWNATVADTEDVAALQEKLERSERSLAERESMVADLNAQLQQVRQQCSELQQQLNEASQNSVADVPTMSWDAAVSASDSGDVIALREKLDQVEQSLAQQTENFVEQEALVGELRTQLQSAQLQLETAPTQEILDAELEKSKQLQLRIEQLESELEHSRQVEDVKQSLLKKSEEVHTMQQLVDEKSEEVSRLVQLMDTQTEELNNTKELLEERTELLSRTKQTLEDELENSRQQVEQVTRELTVLTENLEERTEMLEARSRELNNATELVEAKSKELEQLQQSFETERSKTKQQLEEQSEELGNMKQIVDEKEQELVNTKELLEAKLKESNEMEAVHRELEEAHALIQSLIDQEESLKSRQNHKLEENIKVLQEEVASLIHMQETVTHHIEVLQREKSEAVELAKAEIDAERVNTQEARNRVAQLEDELSNLKDALHQTQESLSDAENALNQANEEQSALHDAVSRLKVQVEDKDDQINVLRETAAELDELHACIADLRSEAESLKEEKAELQPYKIRVEELETELRQAGELQVKVAELSKNETEQSKALVERDARIEELSSQLSALHIQEDAFSQASVEITELKQEVQVRDAALASLSAKTTGLLTFIKALQKQRDEARDEAVAAFDFDQSQPMEDVVASAGLRRRGSPSNSVSSFSDVIEQPKNGDVGASSGFDESNEEDWATKAHELYADIEKFGNVSDENFTRELEALLVKRQVTDGEHSELQAKYDSLSLEMEERDAQYQAVSMQNEGLAADLDARNDECNDLKNLVDDLQSRISMLATIEQERDNLVTKIQELEEMVSTLQSELQNNTSSSDNGNLHVDVTAPPVEHMKDVKSLRGELSHCLELVGHIEQRHRQQYSSEVISLKTNDAGSVLEVASASIVEGPAPVSSSQVEELVLSVADLRSTVEHCFTLIETQVSPRFQHLHQQSVISSSQFQPLGSEVVAIDPSLETELVQLREENQVLLNQLTKMEEQMALRKSIFGKRSPLLPQAITVEESLGYGRVGPPLSPGGMSLTASSAGASDYKKSRRRRRQSGNMDDGAAVGIESEDDVGELEDNQAWGEDLAPWSQPDWQGEDDEEDLFTSPPNSPYRVLDDDDGQTDDETTQKRLGTNEVGVVAGGSSTPSSGASQIPPDYARTQISPVHSPEGAGLEQPEDSVDPPVPRPGSPANPMKNPFAAASKLTAMPPRPHPVSNDPFIRSRSNSDYMTVGATGHPVDPLDGDPSIVSPDAPGIDPTSPTMQAWKPEVQNENVVQGQYDQGQYDQSQGQYDQSQGQYGQSQGQYDQGQYDQSQGQYDQSHGQYDQGQYDQSHGQYEQGQYNQSQGQYDHGQYDPSQTQYDQTQGQVDPSQTQYDQTHGQVDPSQTQYDQTQPANGTNESLVESLQVELNEAKSKLKEQEVEIQKLSEEKEKLKELNATLKHELRAEREARLWRERQQCTTEEELDRVNDAQELLEDQVKSLSSQVEYLQRELESRVESSAHEVSATASSAAVDATPGVPSYDAYAAYDGYTPAPTDAVSNDVSQYNDGYNNAHVSEQVDTNTPQDANGVCAEYTPVPRTYETTPLTYQDQGADKPNTNGELNSTNNKTPPANGVWNGVESDGMSVGDILEELNTVKDELQRREADVVELSEEIARIQYDVLHEEAKAEQAMKERANRGTISKLTPHLMALGAAFAASMAIPVEEVLDTMLSMTARLAVPS